MKAKRVIRVIVLLMISLILPSCSTPESNYKSAQGLLAKGRYTEAADKFASLGSYEDAATLAMYCKACALCENGDYDTGIAGFEALGDYKDCEYRITYYTARAWDDGSVGTTNYECMERAKETYQEIPLYLDSAERIAALDKRIEKVKKQTYDDAVVMAEKGQYDDAIDILWNIVDYEDSRERIRYYYLREQEDALTTSADHDALLTLATDYSNKDEYLDCTNRAEVLKQRANAIIDEKYQVASDLMTTEKYMEALVVFNDIKTHKDIAAQIAICRTTLLNENERHNVISGGVWHTVGLKADGTVVAVGDNGSGQCEVSNWKDIVDISVGRHHTVGLITDGTVVAVGSNAKGRCEVSSWKDIVAISAGDKHTVGLKADGTVVAVGDNSQGHCKVSSWESIVAISAGFSHTVGLKADGTVVAVGKNSNDECEVSSWQDIVAISAGYAYTVGLKADGTVVAVGENGNGQCEVSGWKDIVAISAGKSHTVALKADGTVVAAGDNGNGQCEVGCWEDIVAIGAGYAYTVGLKADGTVVTLGDNSNGQCEVNEWELKQISRPHR